MSDLPEIRIGTAEREHALEALTQHFSDGRLTVTEFDERSGRIAAATTRGQLDTVFADLPSLTPSTPSKVASEPEGADREKTWRNTVMAVIPFVALALFFVVPIDNSWLFFLLIPAAAAILFGGKDGRRGRGGC
ncbi:DUF1707 SHOCT-like domain-containing protein [Rhodococcus sp. SGAir0479]|uniref:DUF1707 SHOCT-like domain-containing protein n=1 Tax=Rhodococcus sp. SGAir0479 TaxID=2567884 RepID=UPI0010CCE581|nr:DUF1707 domain-containing protein [Rhodococcus sp. SGAir0479]QCQ92043.1 DUF1707 domain-containing protein [Rhodococcus sp. SGAir0479]